MIGAARGCTRWLCMPENVTPERKRILRACGADSSHRSDGRLRRRNPPRARIYPGRPGPLLLPGPVQQPANWQAHYQSTGPEILAQTDGAVTHFVAGLGTSGTFVGTGRFLRERAPHVQLVSVQPDTALHGLEGMKHMETAMVPGIYDATLADVDMRVGTEESYQLTKRLALEEGLLVGISSGAALAAGLRVADSLEAGLVVMVFADGGEKYLSERFWEEPPEGSFVSGVN